MRFIGKCKYPLVLGAVLAAALTMAASALAWHVQDVIVTTVCTNNTYVVSATITQSSKWPGATIKSITPASFPGNTTGTKAVVVVVKWPNSNDTQTLTKSVTLDGKCVPPPVDTKCPEGYTPAGKSEGVLLCTKETIKTETVTNTVVEYRDVPGPTVEKIVPVEKVVEKLVPGKTITKVVKVKGKTKYVKVKGKTKIKKVAQIGVCKRLGGGTAVQGSG